jgi:lipopolysaccharide transport system permease protein
MGTSQIVIEPGRAERQYWRDLWRYRELLYFLAWRDVTVHYKQTLIGVAWALLRPLATMAVFVIIFHKVAKLPSDGVPYALLVLAGMLPWQFFAATLSESSNSLVNNANLISKVYFPRLIVPTSAVAVSFIDLLVSAPVLIGLMVYYQQAATWRLLCLPIFLVLTVLAALGAGLWFSALNVRYRDVRYVIPFLIQFGLYLSPVGFRSSLVPEDYRLWYALNPVVGVIDGFRWAILGVGSFPTWELGISAAVGTLVTATGIRYFRATEQTFADVI